VISYGIKETMRLIEICKKKYDYDMRATIEDIKNGRLNATPLPARLLKPIFG